MRQTKSAWFLFLSLVVFVLDRFLKTQLFRSEQLEISIISQLLNFTLHKNYGIGANLALPQSLTIILSLIIITALTWWLVKSNNKKTKLALVLILTGAISNLIDRVVYGFVVDYISFVNLSFINLADLLIFLGLLSLIFQKRERPA